MPAGYSKTPLPKKLGIKEGFSVGLFRPPDQLEKLLTPMPEGARLGPISRGRDFPVALLFARNRNVLDSQLDAAAGRIAVDGALWICWPKKSSALFMDLTEDGVRELCLPSGLVDVKVCAVDEDWSGLKLMFRREQRDAVRQSRVVRKK